MSKNFKSVLVIIMLAIIFMGMFILENKTYASNTKNDNSVNSSNGAVIPKEQESRLIEIKDKHEKSLESYKIRYNSEMNGLVAYILNAVRIYSIPFCFLGIIVGFIYKQVMGRRNIANLEKGLGTLIVVVTVTIICQVLPLIFDIIVKVGRE